MGWDTCDVPANELLLRWGSIVMRGFLSFYFSEGLCAGFSLLQRPFTLREMWRASAKCSFTVQ